MRAPSFTPAGMRARISRVRTSAPEPLHCGHGSGTTRPLPWQVGHGSEKPNKPWLFEMTPAPPHCEHGTGLVPGLAPDPWHIEHGARPATRSVVVTPARASSNDSVRSVST